MQDVRYAVVGTGYISQDAFMPSVAGTGNSRMTAIISGNPEGARKLADFYGIEHIYSYAQYDEACAAGTFDAVYIALPNSMHAEYTIRAARHGIHALVEKPLAMSVAECEAMVAAAAEHNTSLMTAYRLHCVPGMIEPLRRIRAGEIGDAKFVNSVLSVVIPQSNHRWQAAHWGGPLQDLGVYCLNAARHVFGAEPVEVVALSADGSGDETREIDETLSAVLAFPQGRLASITASFSGADVDMLRIVGTQGEIEVTPAYRAEAPLRAVLRKGGQEHEIEMQDTDHFGSQTAYFSQCILTNSPVRPDGAEGLADVVTMHAIEEAARTGVAQKVDIAHRVQNPDLDMFRFVPRTKRKLFL